MPNATCFLIGYSLVLISEWVRFASRGEQSARWATRVTLGLFAISLLTHTLYLLDRVQISTAMGDGFKPFATWHDWVILLAWGISLSFAFMMWRRSDKQIGLFVLPLILLLVGLAITVPVASPIAGVASTVSFWRLVHSAAMLIGTVLVAIGFAVAAMYLVQARRLKQRVASGNSIRLPSLEYLQSTGRNCILGSAASIGFGVVSGAIMNLTRDGQVAWTDRGIIFTGGLFVWLCIAAIAQWVSANRGRGEWTAMMSILSFIIVVIVLAMVVTAPHGAGEQSPAVPAVEGKQVEIRYPAQCFASSVCVHVGTIPRGLA
ncbi:MAG: cytochrome c biogenesis protein CcsA [Pirellula sp.]|jgi:hypothetical protein